MKKKEEKKRIRGNKIVSKILFMVIGTAFSVKGACSGVAVSLAHPLPEETDKTRNNQPVTL